MRLSPYKKKAKCILISFDEIWGTCMTKVFDKKMCMYYALSIVALNVNVLEVLVAVKYPLLCNSSFFSPSIVIAVTGV